MGSGVDLRRRNYTGDGQTLSARDRVRDLGRVQTVEQRIEDGVRRIGTFVQERVADFVIRRRDDRKQRDRDHQDCDDPLEAQFMAQVAQRFLLV